MGVISLLSRQFQTKQEAESSKTGSYWQEWSWIRCRWRAIDEAALSLLRSDLQQFFHRNKFAHISTSIISLRCSDSVGLKFQEPKSLIQHLSWQQHKEEGRNKKMEKKNKNLHEKNEWSWKQNYEIHNCGNGWGGTSVNEWAQARNSDGEEMSTESRDWMQNRSGCPTWSRNIIGQTYTDADGGHGNASYFVNLHLPQSQENELTNINQIYFKWFF